jgi:uncharacterized membrane protein HdeD (DUF308 family)
MIIFIFFIIAFLIVNYIIDKNDDIWDDEVIHALFPKSKKLHIKILYLFYLIFAGVAIWFDYDYGKQIPIYFLACLIGDWMLIVFLLWNHSNNEKNKAKVICFGIFSTIVLFFLHLLYMI